MPRPQGTHWWWIAADCAAYLLPPGGVPFHPVVSVCMLPVHAANAKLMAVPHPLPVGLHVRLPAPLAVLTVTLSRAHALAWQLVHNALGRG